LIHYQYQIILFRQEKDTQLRKY